MMINKRFLCSFLLIAVIGFNVVSQNLTAVRVDANYPPYEMVVDGKLTGLHIDLVNEIARQLNLNITFESLPWARAINMVETGTADVITYIGKTAEREGFLYYNDGNVLSSSNYALMILKSRADDIKFTGNLRSVAEYNIGVLRGYSYGDNFDKADFLQKSPVNDTEQLMNMLKASRIDIAMIDEPEYFQQINTGNWNDFVLLYPVVTSRLYYIGFSKASNLEPLSNKFAEALAKFKETSEYQDILKKYGLNN